jgi:hypothetical protein
LRSGGLSFDVPSCDVDSDLLGALYSPGNRSTGKRDAEHIQYKLDCVR